MRPFAAFSTSVGRFAPHANIAYQWSGQSVIAGDVAGQKGDLPDQFGYALGSDVGVTDRWSGARRHWPARAELSASADARHDGIGSARNGDAAGHPLRNSVFLINSTALGFEVTVAPSILIDFNPRFNTGSNGLADRVAPLLGFEWAF